MHPGEPVIVEALVASQALIRDRYQLEAMIGRGGAKDVYRAFDRSAGSRVALARVLAVDAEEFLREVELARRVEREHVAAILDAFIEDGDGFLVMELCEGPTLADTVADGPMPLDRAAPILVAFARGLEAIHDAHVLHRDIKLENVILSSGGLKLSTLNILDFGLAREAPDELTCAGAMPAPQGTMGYAAPEVFRGEELDARTDVYSLGVCYFRLLTGELPLTPGKDFIVYLQELTSLERHDLSALDRVRGLPPELRSLIERMLSTGRDDRPYMPVVRSTLERLFPSAAAQARAPRPAREGARDSEQTFVGSNPRADRAIQMAPFARIASEGSCEPDALLIATCPHAPLVSFHPGQRTTVRAMTADGALRWRTEIDGRYGSAIRVDLDNDGVREIYLAGGDRITSLDARGNVRFTRTLPPDARPPDGGAPTMLAIPQSLGPRLIVDGYALDSEGSPRMPLPFAYEGDGKKLIDASSRRGISYNGFAHQAFRGASATPAAILMRPGERDFLVAHLEVAHERASARALLSVYGPGGGCRHRLPVATSELATGDRRAIERLRTEAAASFGPEHAPIAWLEADGSAIVVAPLTGQVEPFPSTVAAFRLPEGRELWRLRIGSERRARALLADADGDGRPELLLGAGDEILVIELTSGRILASLPIAGAPVAYGDPFGSGYGHLFTAGARGFEIWRGPEVLPGLVQWSGARADLWRTGTLRHDGVPVGPV